MHAQPVQAVMVKHRVEVSCHGILFLFSLGLELVSKLELVYELLQRHRVLLRKVDFLSSSIPFSHFVLNLRSKMSY